MTIQAHLLHAVPGRVRLKCLDLAPEALAALERQLIDAPAVERIQANPVTATVLLQGHALRLDQLQPYLEAQGIHLTAPEAQRHSPWARTRSVMEHVEQQMRRQSHGDWDTRSVVLLFLLMMAGRQLLRGQVMVPAVSLLWYALQLVLPGNRPGANGR